MEQNLFEIIGIETRFDIDLAELEKAYFDKQKLYHPDKAAKLPIKEKIDAAQKSIDFNLAYQTLKNPVRRAEHLLDIAGYKEKKSSQELLEEMLEIREQLMEAESKEQLEEINKKAHVDYDAAIKQFNEEFKNKKYEAAIQTVLKMNYLAKFFDEVKAKTKSMAAAA